jgi:hypothetical protein
MPRLEGRQVLVLAVFVIALLASIGVVYWSFTGMPGSAQPTVALKGEEKPSGKAAGGALPPPAAIPAPPARLHPNTARTWADDPAAKGKPIAKGFPIVLPAPVKASPVTADLDGDGDREIVMTAFVTSDGQRLIHDAPDVAAMLYAFHHDGTPVTNWPVAIVETADRQQELDSGHWYAHIWASAPAVADIDGDRKDEILVVGPKGIGGVVVIYGNGGFRRLAGDADAWGSVPVVDLNEDRRLDAILGRTQRGTDNRPIPGWRNKLHGGYSPTIGDANGDGHREVFHPVFEKDSIIGGFTHTGETLPGWPQRVEHLIVYPVMGDLTGDGKMEIVGIDQADRILVWQADGSPLPANAGVHGAPHVFVSRSPLGSGFIPPSLADLDGDGAAEIVVCDASGALVAWHADGRMHRVASVEPDPYFGGGRVTVADLGGDGVMDLFTPGVWLRVPREAGRHVEKTMLLNPPARVTTAVTIDDLTGDGKADLLFGTADGRVFVYETGLAIRDEWLQWPMECHNPRRTSAWVNPAKRN